jgi:hypothetical protein
MDMVESEELEVPTLSDDVRSHVPSTFTCARMSHLFRGCESSGKSVRSVFTSVHMCGIHG